MIEVIIRVQQDAMPASAAAPDRSSVAAIDEVEPLTHREQDVLRLLALGLTNREIGARLFLTEGTIKRYVKHILGKLGVRNRLLAAQHPQALRVLAARSNA